MFLRETLCLFCLSQTARLGLDRKQRPYVHCIACGARSFLPLFDPCLNGLALVPALIEAWRATTNEATRKAQLAVFLNELRTRARSAAQAPAPTADEALGAAAQKVAAS